MRLLDRLMPGRATAAAVTDPATFPIASPWASTDLARIVYEEVFGNGAPPNTRAAAMRIPAVARGRNLIVGTIARFPLVAMRGDAPQPLSAAPWLAACHDGSTPQARLAWTVDDLLFYGWSLWELRRAAPTSGSWPLSAARISRERWDLDGDNHLHIDGMLVRDTADLILIPGLHEGILTYGVDAIRDTKALYAVVRERINNPVPQVDLHQTGGKQLNADEIRDLRNDWAAARTGQNGGVAYTNEWIEAKPFGNGGENLLIEARNAAALDLARMMGVHGGMIDATTPKASLNYETTSGRNGEFLDLDLALYMTPITARLSLDDVVPRGQRVALDTIDFASITPDPTGPTSED